MASREETPLASFFADPFDLTPRSSGSMTQSISHLQRLEAESIHIFREVAAEFSHPVLLYSIGKDSSVLLHLALKAFFPAKPPFPLLHIDTTWKFKEMIAFRDETARRLGLDLLVHVNSEGLQRGINPIASGSSRHTQVMKTEALRQALDKYGFDAAIGGARRDEERSRAKERIFSFRDANHVWDPRNQRPELWRLFNTRNPQGREYPRLPTFELDRTRRLAIYHARKYSSRRLVFCEGCGQWFAVKALGSWLMTIGFHCRPARYPRIRWCAFVRLAATH